LEVTGSLCERVHLKATHHGLVVAYESSSQHDTKNAFDLVWLHPAVSCPGSLHLSPMGKTILTIFKVTCTRHSGKRVANGGDLRFLCSSSLEGLSRKKVLPVILWEQSC
jgi:hypothetical protein